MSLLLISISLKVYQYKKKRDLLKKDISEYLPKDSGYQANFPLVRYLDCVLPEDMIMSGTMEVKQPIDLRTRIFDNMKYNIFFWNKIFHELLSIFSKYKISKLVQTMLSLLVFRNQEQLGFKKLFIRFQWFKRLNKKRKIQIFLYRR